MPVSTPEATTFDLVRYAHLCGGLDHVATVLSELAEAIDATRLTTLAEGEPVAHVQRVGWLLDHVGASVLADALASRLREDTAWWTPLAQPRNALAGQRTQRV